MQHNKINNEQKTISPLCSHNDHYQWQKVTSCIHNVLGGQRWVDQYGETTITNGDKCSCKLTFVKVHTSVFYLFVDG